MPYEKQTWSIGDVITAERLNHMETGLAATNETERSMYARWLDEAERTGR